MGMDYAFLFSVMGVSILYLTYRNFVTHRELNKAKMIAALLIAEKMGMKIDGEKVKLDFVEMKERDL
jgi:hypothetical protein